MKIRNSFVSNSSSTSFVIFNKTKNNLDLREFVKENPQLVTDFLEEYGWIDGYKDLSKEEFIKLMCNEVLGRFKFKTNSDSWLMKKTKGRAYLKPGENLVNFGDEEGTIIGNIYDYSLRDGGESKRFKWWLDHFER